MSEAAPETPETQAPPEGQQETQEQKTFDADYVEKLRKENAKYRTEAKSAATELEKVRQASMSEAEKAVAEAEARGKASASAEWGKRFATAQFNALAARRNPDFDTSPVLEYVDMGKFLTDAGEVDEKALTAAVDRMVPPPAGGIPNFDGGARKPASKPANMNDVIRRAAGVVA